MTKKRLIDKIRDSGGMADIGTDEDGAIVDMTKIGERLFIIKENSIYEYLLGDNIDPNRSNINLPNGIQKIIHNQGTESEYVCRTFLTARTLLRTEYFEKTINIENALTLSLEFLQEVAVLNKELDDYLLQEEKAIIEYEHNRNKANSYAIPSINDVEVRCTTIFQKADHLEQIIMEIITVFYPESGLTKQSHFPKLYEFLKKKYNQDERFASFIKEQVDLMKIVRETRNSLDHRLGFAQILNFEIRPDGSIITPTIELNFKKITLQRQSLSNYLPILFESLINIFELTLAYLCDYNSIKSLINHGVREIPEEKRRFKYVRFGFWTPMGQDGYYKQ